jgi:uncharacterized membrane protein
MTKLNLQISIIVIGILTFSFAIRTMLHTRTLIITPLYLVLVYVPIILSVSFLLGLLIKKIAKGAALKGTYTFLCLTLFSIAYMYYEYKPTRDIILPANFSGDVMLFLSKEDKDDFNINSYGIGYISMQTYLNGFRPVVFRDGNNITKDLTKFSGGGSISSASINGISLGPFHYMKFTVPGQPTNEIELLKLIEIKALDTTRITNQTDIND